MTKVWEAGDLAKRNACPGCGAQPPPNVRISRGDGLYLRQCSCCAVLFVDPAPSPGALLRYYDAHYFDGGKDFFHGVDYREVRDQAIAGDSVTGYRELLSRFDVAGKSILDVGCATGALLESLKSHGPARLVGIDVAESALAFGRERYGLDLRCADLERAAFAAQEFDLIVMIDVIEHIYDLRGFFSEASRILRSGGALFVSTPNAGAFEIAGGDWGSLRENYEHVLYLSRSSLSNVVERHGLRVETAWSEGCPVPSWQYHGSRRGRLLHIAVQPHVAAHNWMTRWKFRNAAALGGGLQLNAIIRSMWGSHP